MKYHQISHNKGVDIYKCEWREEKGVNEVFKLDSPSTPPVVKGVNEIINIIDPGNYGGVVKNLRLNNGIYTAEVVVYTD